METKDAILKRHSTRYFADRPIDMADIKAILTLAQQAPSWVNSQPERLYLATGQTLATIRQGYADRAADPGAAHPEVPVMGRADWSKQGQDNMALWSQGIGTTLGQQGPAIMNDAGNKLYNAPAVLYLTLPKHYSLWSLYDLGAFGQTLMLMAVDKGLDSITAYQLIKYPDLLRANLPISDDEIIISGIALGYRDDVASVNKITAKRQKLDDILSIND